jgi:hypothetical protein
LLKKAGEGEFVEVDTDTWFRAGDSIRLTVEPNRAGYLYILQLGASGRWSLLYASDGRLAGGRRHEIPVTGEFTFDDRAGTERLFLLLSRRPEPSLENKAKSAPLPDSLTVWLGDQARNRDLVLEKVTEAPGQPRENALYVVNRQTTADSRVVLELALRHR